MTICQKTKKLEKVVEEEEEESQDEDIEGSNSPMTKRSKDQRL